MANQYIREVLHSQEAPPAIPVRYFYTSQLAIDDPLSPLPPIATGPATGRKQPPRPFSEYDNEAVNKTWLSLRKKILKHNEELGEKHGSAELQSTPTKPIVARLQRRRGLSTSGEESSAETTHGNQPSLANASPRAILSGSFRASETGNISPSLEPATTGTPFIRAPSRGHVAHIPKSGSVDGRRRPAPHELDSYSWDENTEPALPGRKDKGLEKKLSKPKAGLLAKVPVGVARLHHVVMDAERIRMEPIYWSPVNDIADVVRGTWFYKDTMMPVEVEVANMLEAGYIDLKPWTQTWADELNSAIEVGALGEVKILHKLWPEKPLRPEETRPGSSAQMHTGLIQSMLPAGEEDPEKLHRDNVENACDLIDISTGPEGPDNKASGDTEYGREGQKNLYRKAGVIYANEKEAYLLRPSLQPSKYYGRRPLANYIRRGRPIGLCVTRGFDQQIWDKLHPLKNTPIAIRAREGVSTAQAGAPPNRRQKSDPTLALSERPQVTDLVLVIHGIGQKLSERMETYHFTHAINAFRKDVNVQLGTPDVKRHLRKDMGGIMVLPVNWRQRVTLAEAQVNRETEEDDSTVNQYNLKDITPNTIPSVRGIVSDVMLDVPYYLSPLHNQKMVSACIQEANRIYRLWCLNNPGFSEWGRVHLIAHSLGSVMAVDILSQQPSHVPPQLGEPSYPEEDLPQDHFIFNTKSLFVCGSPVGLFLLLKKSSLLPRRDKEKPGADSHAMPGVAGEQGTYGCIAVDNIYNIVNPYDPVAYHLNAALDVRYSESLKPAVIPSAEATWFAFANPFRKTDADALHSKPSTVRLPSNVELETHNFTKEEIVEKRAYLLNDNGQIDYGMKYGGGALDIQYLTILGAHSSYWVSKDFVRMIVVEIGRALGKEGTLPAMRAQKKKTGAA